MDPNQLPPDYNFIINSQSSNSRGPAFLQNTRNRLLAMIGFGAVVLILLIVGFNIISNIGKANNDDLVTLAAYQTELIRLAEFGQDATSPDTRAQTKTLEQFMKTDLSATTSYAAKQGTKIVPLQLAAKKDSSLEEDLEKARQRNSYDEELRAAIASVTKEYRASLQSAINATGDAPNRQALLDTAANNIIAYTTPK